jgi:hypothetical protein
MKNLSLLFFAFVFLIACQNNKTEENTTNENNKENTVDPQLKKIEEIKKNLIGSWTVSQVKDEELTESEKSALITFKAGGIVSNSNVEGDKKWDVKSMESKEFLIIGDEKMEIVSCDDKKLVFIADKEEVTLLKK